MSAPLDLLVDRARAGGRRALAFPCVTALVQATAPLVGRLAFVGGVVRDWMMDTGGPDIDFLWDGDLLALHAALDAAGAEPRLRAAYRTMSYSCGGVTFDIAGPRQDTYPVPGGVPSVGIGDLGTDARRRDFTCNAMRLWIGGNNVHLDDPLGGIADLAHGALRPIRADTLVEDPLRLLRGARYLARYEWSPAGEWDAGIAQARELATWRNVAVGRLWSEARLIADEPDPAGVWSRLRGWQIDVPLWGEPLGDQVLRAWTAWRTAHEPERPGTGRNALIDMAVVARLQPTAIAHALALWRPEAGDRTRIDKFLRQVGAAGGNGAAQKARAVLATLD